MVTARHRVVRVPATSANLGPGYDVMAAAVDLFMEVEVEEAGEFSFDPAGLDLPTGRDNLMVRAFESLHPADGIAFRMKESIPLARGLGSSAAAVVAGLIAADHLYELALSREEMLVRATEIEGHPDNVAAAIYGGIVVCDPVSEEKDPDCSCFPPPDGLEGIAVIPFEEVSTERAREAIPGEIPLGDALGNIFAASRLVLGLYRGDLGLIAASLPGDRIHQQRRRELYPRSMDLVESAAEIGALGATISGAGPTVLVWTTWQDAGKVSEELERRSGDWAEVRRLPFTPQGADVPEL